MRFASQRDVELVKKPGRTPKQPRRVTVATLIRRDLPAQAVHLSGLQRVQRPGLGRDQQPQRRIQLTGVPVMYGNNFFRVQAVSAAGNTSEQSASFFSHTRSTTPPAVSIHLVNDTGITLSDGKGGMITILGGVVTVNQGALLIK